MLYTLSDIKSPLELGTCPHCGLKFWHIQRSIITYIPTGITFLLVFHSFPYVMIVKAIQKY